MCESDFARIRKVVGRIGKKNIRTLEKRNGIRKNQK